MELTAPSAKREPPRRGDENLRGIGVKATVDGEPVHLGGPNLLAEFGVDRPTDIETFADEAGSNAQTVIYLITNDEISAAFALADVIREESRQTIDALHEMGIEVAMLTGDSEDVARAVTAELGIDQYFAEVLPEEKDETVAERQGQGKRVAMVGDGVNDAPALTRADVGIAIGSGTDVAIESGDIILVENNPLDVVRLITLSKASYRKMQENLVWATGYNVVALPCNRSCVHAAFDDHRRHQRTSACGGRPLTVTRSTFLMVASTENLCQYDGPAPSRTSTKRSQRTIWC
jgi:ATPase, P-type (transporting), HAD superfamily, subfamily IC